jgi:hypothetical protein
LQRARESAAAQPQFNISQQQNRQH